ncbi:hypothetical protein IW140_001392 [Coemansia sp. RSA 1813]|nr:hypothetical protein LPJ74_001651 [Coemansia sp. RSA 1843]KAJ2091853.1 hypothetical protein IW138_001542 [Coemansia sp. RSA 986]KAJ2215820.1 hypothetical protein EV179_001840 [Coemansia sp. RSA 487]KAJ2571751.1 hypothetical protein IW140_001392 [Coemansia sp. RSA 1813]
MPTKREYPAGDDAAPDNAPSGESSAQKTNSSSSEPYTTYQQAHEAIVSLKSMQSKSGIHETTRRALISIESSSLPSAVRQAAVRLARHLCAYPETDTAAIVSVLVRTLDTAAPSTRCEMYNALLRLNEFKGIFSVAEAVPGKVMASLEAFVLRDLNHAQHHLRCAALSVLPLVWMGGKSDSGKLFETICGYTADSHPKVRQTALSSILQQHTMGVVLPVDTYDDCVAATKDDFEQVRLVAVELMYVISSTYPEYPVVIQKYKVSESIRLLDDSFVKICDMVNDSSVVVRQRACTILGRFKTVDAKFLSQTFSKQVMSHLRRFVPRGGVRGYSGRNRGVRSKGAIPTPQGDADVESEEFRLLDSGAAGAFVHGLEDEYQEVRDAAIESITELCTASADFSVKAVDFLVDMFNDSSDRVRVCAIRALTSIGEQAAIQLTEEQLSIAYSAMKDSSRRVREGIYRFLSVSTLAKSEWLERLMSGFKANLEKYPEDQAAIYGTLRALGQNHSHVVTIHFARTLLGISEHYLSREARLDDTVYAGNVILIMNTKPALRKAIAEALPDYVSTHLPYLSDKYPGCLPHDIANAVPSRLAFVKQMLERPQSEQSVSQLALGDSRKRLADIFGTIVKTLESASSYADSDRMDDRDERACRSAATMLASKAREFNALCGTVDPDKAVPDERQKAVARYAQLISHVLDAQHISDKPLQQPQTLKLASLVMYQAYELDARTIGLGSTCKLALAGVRLFAHAAWLNAHTLIQYDHRLADKMVGELLQRMKQTIGLQGAENIHKLSDSLHQLEQRWQTALSFPGDSRNSDASRQEAYQAFGDELLAFVLQFKPMQFAPQGLCQHALAHFQHTAAAAAAKHSIEYNHAFPLRLSLTASLEWVERRSAVAIAVTLPTQRTLYLSPPLSSLKPRLPMHWAVDWDDVPLSLPLSSGESTAVRLSVALHYRAQMPWTDAFVIAEAVVPDAYTVEDYFKSIGDPGLSRHISIDIAHESHSVSVNPVEVRAPASIHTRI